MVQILTYVLPNIRQAHGRWCSLFGLLYITGIHSNMELRTMFWLHFWLLSAAILRIVSRVEHIFVLCHTPVTPRKERFSDYMSNVTIWSTLKIPHMQIPHFVYSLDQSFNKILFLYLYFFEAYDISILLLRNSNIGSINSRAFHSLHHLLNVDLSYNAFISIPTKLFIQNRKLHRLSLCNNMLITLQEDVPILTSSSILHLDLSK